MLSKEGRGDFEQATLALCSTEERSSVWTTLDALRAYVYFPKPGESAHGGFPLTTNAQGELSVMGKRRFWTQASATEVLSEVFTPEALEQVSDCVALHREQAVDALPELFFVQVGYLLLAGWTKDYGLRWSLALTCSYADLLSLSARWSVRWGLQDFHGAVEQGLTYEELEHVLVQEFPEVLPKSD